MQSHRELGSAWVEISKRLPGRTDNAIKNRWNSSMRKRYASAASLSPSKPTALPGVLALPTAIVAAAPPPKRIKMEATSNWNAAPRCALGSVERPSSAGVAPRGASVQAAGLSACPRATDAHRPVLASTTTVTLSVVSVAPRSAPNTHRRRSLQVKDVVWGGGAWRRGWLLLRVHLHGCTSAPRTDSAAVCLQYWRVGMYRTGKWRRLQAWARARSRTPTRPRRPIPTWSTR